MNNLRRVFLILVFSHNSLTAQDMVTCMNEMTKAIVAEDMSTLKQLCTSEFWTFSEDSGEDLFEQAIRKKFILEAQKTERKDNRAVVTANVTRDSKILDRVYLYFLFDGKAWILDGVNETEAYYQYFLDTVLRGHFSCSEIPVLNSFNEKGASLNRFEAIPDWIDQENSGEDVLAQLLKDDNKKMVYENTRFHPKLKRGYFTFKNNENEYSNFILYFRPSSIEGKWIVYGWGYGYPDKESLLH